MSDLSNIKRPKDATGVIVLADKTVIWGRGFGAETSQAGEICFNTSLTGYQEVLTDPSYAGQIITFTFPHIGNVGTNNDDNECTNPFARGLITREDITAPSNWRATSHFDTWLKSHNLPGISAIDTRALTQMIRDKGAPVGVIAHDPDGRFDLLKLHEQALAFGSLNGMDLAKDVSCKAPYSWDEGVWTLENGYSKPKTSHKVVAVDFGAKRNILRCLVQAGCDVTVVPAQTSAPEILAMKPDGVFLSNGPGDPEATGVYAVPMIQEIIKSGVPLFGICLGHQLLARALGGTTRKMHLGHRGGNHPVKDLETGKVEITSQNHGFEVVEDSLPDGVMATHISLFDGSNEGLRVTGKPVFSVQYHPEASPGPEDSVYLFERFVEMIKKQKAA